MTDPIPAEGDFSWSPDGDMLEDAYRAITVAEAWDLMKLDPGEGGYMFGGNPNCKTIRLQYPGHSGASYGLTMRAMQYLAHYGWNAFYAAYHHV
jgi:hypothetical protein